MRWIAHFFTSFIPAVPYVLGQNLSAYVSIYSRTAEVYAKRKSVSILIFAILVLYAFFNKSLFPTDFLINPPWLLMLSTYSCSISDAPCKTIGVFGISFSIFFKMSYLILGSPTYLFTPWFVPIETASESTPVNSTNSFACLGLVNLSPSLSIPSSFETERTPSSPSTETLNLCAYVTTFFVSLTFSLKGRVEPSIITLSKPSFITLLHISKSFPWSRCIEIGNLIFFTAWIIPNIISSEK